jgi:hypothetical protein
MNHLASLLSLTFFLTTFVATAHAAVPERRSDEKIDFTRDVQPILAENCFACHGFDKKNRQADLRLDVREAAVGKEGGVQAIVPGNPQQSELWSRLSATDDDLRMPPADSGKRLTTSERETLRLWIEQGAPYAPHWAFRAPAETEPPLVPGAEHPIDRFIQKRLNEERLPASPEAAKYTLIRRVSLDLTGLPPTPDEVEDFRSDNDPDAYERLIDRLLASPHYGERWGRWWLDQARYADSNGYSIDSPRDIWKYRDWVVSAINADMPFDQFTVEQLAGDLLPGAADAQRVATGFHRNTQINQEGGIDKEQYRIDSIFDRVATTGTVWLGLTIGCAQCHDHKFDPIEQKEYYRLFAFLNNQDETTLTLYEPGVDVTRLTAARKAAEKSLAEYFKEHADELAQWEQALDEPARKKLSAALAKILNVAPEKRSIDQNRQLFAAALGKDDDVFDKLNQRYADVEAELNRGVPTMVLQERAQPRQTTVFIQGDFTRPAEEVTPGTPAVLHPLNTKNELPNRLDLARWIASPENPLTARVIANRIWQQYFGAGIVETENDFGLIGTPPSHPALLDWLAVQFQKSGWSMKHVHRLIVTSHAYRQSSHERDDLRQKDPDNRLLARQQRLRLDAELVRDVALATSGLLAPKLGGPPVFPPIPAGVTDLGQVKRAWVVSSGQDRYRRGLYTFRYRATPPPSLNVFDAPDGYMACTRRNRSNTPLQALTLMNDASFFEFAVALEKIIERDGLEAAFRRCTGRDPDTTELAVLKRLSSLNAARVLLNLDETITRE